MTASGGHDSTVKVSEWSDEALAELAAALSGGGGGGAVSLAANDPGLLALAASLETISALVSGVVAVSNQPSDFPDSAALAKLELIRLLIAGTIAVSGTVALDAPTLAALESITAAVSNFPADYPDAATLAKVEAVRALLAGTLAIAGTVALDAPTLAALETITANQGAPGATAWLTSLAAADPGLVALAAALESISVQNFPADYPDAAVLAKVEAVRALLAGTIAVSGPLTDAQLRAAGVPVTGTFWQATQPVSGPLTDTQLRAVAVPVSAASLPLPTGAATQTTLAAVLAALATVPVTGPLTDTQLRAAPVPVSGTVTTTGGLTDTQLRATAVPVSGTFYPGTQPVSGTVTALSALVPFAYDYISLGYTGSNLTTVTYKTGGSGGSTVATLTLAYSGSTLTSVTRS